jgi:adenine deaminase
MDLRYTPEQEAFRAEARAWLEANVPGEPLPSFDTEEGFALHRELELYVKAGMTPLEAIQAATITPARVMKLDNEVGTIEAGRRADLIVLDASPVENISNIRKVRLVVTQGRLFDCAKLWEIVGFQP